MHRLRARHARHRGTGQSLHGDALTLIAGFGDELLWSTWSSTPRIRSGSRGLARAAERGRGDHYRRRPVRGAVGDQRRAHHRVPARRWGQV